jgi:hypothetical protein
MYNYTHSLAKAVAWWLAKSNASSLWNRPLRPEAIGVDIVLNL